MEQSSKIRNTRCRRDCGSVSSLLLFKCTSQSSISLLLPLHTPSEHPFGYSQPILILLYINYNITSTRVDFRIKLLTLV